MNILTSLQPLGKARVLISYEYTPGERATRYEPGEEPLVVVLSATINGEEVDSEFFADAQVQQWESDILDEHGDVDDFNDEPEEDDRESVEECARESRA